MATPERIQQLITAPASNCQQIASGIIALPQPKKEYRTYTNQINNMIKDEMWYLLGNPNWVPPIKEIEKRYDINSSSLKYYRTKLKENINWLPNQNRGESQRMFTFQEEQEVVDGLIDLAKKGVAITNNLAQNAFVKKMNKKISKLEEAMELQRFRNKQFAASVKYIQKIRKRHNISIRRVHPKRRPKITIANIEEFRSTAQALYENNSIRKDHILNCDETFWHQIEQSKQTWAYTGEDNVHIYSNVNEKAGTTVLATIDATGQKLPFVIIGKGSTIRCENSQLGFSNPIGNPNSNPYSNTVHYTTHNPSGWMNELIFVEYLSQLRILIPYDPQFPEDSDPNIIYLICDSFPAHHNQTVKTVAEMLNIELIRIPEGCTDECQPLDRRIFGALKQQARAYTAKQLIDAAEAHIESDTPLENYRPTKQESIELLIKIWDQLSSINIMNAWQLALYGCIDGQNEDV